MVFEEKLSHFPARGLEWFGSAMLATWGAQVLMHPGMFESQVPMRGLLEILPSQSTWGIIAFSSGLLRAGALYVNGRHTRTPLVRLITSFSSIFVWFWVSVGLTKSGIPVTGIAIYPWLVVADMYSAYRAGTDCYEAEAQRRLEIISNGSHHDSYSHSS